jgi:hypothetical protein
MTLGGIAFVVSWAPPVAAFFGYSGVNWLAIVSGVLTLGFAYWVIIDLYTKLESKPMLLFKSLGARLLTNRVNRNRPDFPRRLEYLYNVVIVNSSPDKTLGIIDIRLQLKYKNQTKHIPPYVGVPPSDSGNAEEGVIPGTIWLQPNESKEGKLAFVEERSDKEATQEVVIVIVDAQKRKYIFPATVEKMIEANSF